MSWRRTAQAAEQAPSGRSTRQVGEAVVCHGAGQPRQQSRPLQAAARGRPGRLQGRGLPL